MKKIKEEFSRSTNLLVAVSLSLIINSCATVEYQMVDFPVVYLSEFDSCQKGDGSIKINSLLKQDQSEFEVDWAVQKYPSIAMEAYNPMGQTVAAVYYNQKKRTFSGKGIFKGIVENLDNRDGYVYYDGVNSGIRIGELSCFLKAKLPDRWKNKIISSRKTSDGKYNFLTDDGHRLINTEIYKHKGTFRSCSNIQQKRYFGLITYSWNFCINSSRYSRKVSISSEGKTLVSYSVMDD